MANETDDQRIQVLHAQAEKLDSDQLILNLVRLDLEFGKSERTDKFKEILKNYLIRALVREGFRAPAPVAKQTIFAEGPNDERN